MLSPLSAQGESHSVDVSLTMCEGSLMDEGSSPRDIESAEDPDWGVLRESSSLWPDENDPAWLIRLRWHLVDGRYEVSGFEMNAVRDNRTPLTATLLRKVALGSLIEDGLRNQIAFKKKSAGILQRTKESRDTFAEIGYPTNESLQDSLKALEQDTLEEIEVLENPPPRRRYNEEHWELVTAVYDEAWAAGSLTPTKAVAEYFNKTRSTAAKWVSICRKSGLLPPTQKTRPRGNR